MLRSTSELVATRPKLCAGHSSMSALAASLGTLTGCLANGLVPKIGTGTGMGHVICCLVCFNLKELTMLLILIKMQRMWSTD